VCQSPVMALSSLEVSGDDLEEPKRSDGPGGFDSGRSQAGN
jgi:hypothetical protein